MIGDLTYTEFFDLMRHYEQASIAEIDKAWAQWCRDHSPKPKQAA